MRSGCEGWARVGDIPIPSSGCVPIGVDSDARSVFAFTAQMESPMIDPYATPKSFVQENATGFCRRDGRYVFIPVGHDLPRRCIVCNTGVDGPVKTRRLYWYSPWLYLLLFLNVLIFAVAALVARKSARVTPAYCPEHKAARRFRINLFLVPFLILMVVGVVAGVKGYPSVSIPAFVIGVVLLIPLLIVANGVRARRIDHRGTTLAGCKEAFLASLSIEAD